MARDHTPWDIYIDERKLSGERSLGFLVVPNTASFLHKLQHCREKPAGDDGSTIVWREVHWYKPRLDTLAVAIRWIDCIHSHKGAKFFLYNWPLDETKEAVIIRFLRRFCRTKRLSPPYNIVAFLDFASDHAKSRIQNTVRATGQIARCYHLHSHGNDGLQCCDLLLGATSAISANPLLRFEYAALKEMWEKNARLTDSQVKHFVAAHLGLWMDRNASCVHDCRRSVP